LPVCSSVHPLLGAGNIYQDAMHFNMSQVAF
jgi:hypothetical protein